MFYKKLNEQAGILSSYRKIASEFYTSRGSLERIQKDFDTKLSEKEETYKNKINKLLTELFNGLTTQKLILEKDGIKKTPLIDLLELKNVEGIAL